MPLFFVCAGSSGFMMGSNRGSFLHVCKTYWHALLLDIKKNLLTRESVSISSRANSIHFAARSKGKSEKPSMVPLILLNPLKRQYGLIY